MLVHFINYDLQLLIKIFTNNFKSSVNISKLTFNT